jgi:hypothetical protein
MKVTGFRVRKKGRARLTPDFEFPYSLKNPVTRQLRVWNVG